MRLKSFFSVAVSMKSAHVQWEEGMEPTKSKEDGID